MVTGSASTVIRLKDVNMEQIKSHLRNRYENTYNRMEKISESTTELEFETRYNGTDTRIQLSRELHRPMEVKAIVRPARQNYTTSSGQNFADFYNGSILRALAIIVILSIFVRIIIFTTQIALQNNLLLLIIPVGLVVLAFRYLINFGSSNSKPAPSVDYQPLLDQLVGILSELSTGGNNTNIKCWNCFETISTEDNVCAFCGKIQK